jgi:hypothetical protein
MEMKRHVLICLSISMLVGRGRSEVVTLENEVGVNCLWNRPGMIIERILKTHPFIPVPHSSRR